MRKLIKKIIVKSIGLYINLLSYVFPEKATRLAYRLFSEPREGRFRPEEVPEMLKEAMADMITHDDMIFQTYTWKGNDQIILLVHGWESNTSRWENFLPYLKKSGSTIIALDAPAHGLSSGTEFNIPEYAEFVNILVEKYKPQMMVGHSLGGATCLYFLEHYQHPSVEKVVILGAPSELQTILNNFRNMLSLNTKVFRMMEKYLFQHFKIRAADFSGKKFASRLKIKGLVAHDEEDTIVDFEEGKQIAEAWKSAIFIRTKGLGHSLHNRELYQKIYNFLFDQSSVA